jgi:Helix-loop-helix DNA-binding domain
MLDANKKRKIAHSLFEKNYRSRIKDGMAELRHCVPSIRKGNSSLESNTTETQVHADKAKQNHSFGKVATRSDAVQYMKSLELRTKPWET